MILDLLTALGSIATAVGLAVGVGQLRATQRQNRVQFEDGLAKEYRELSQELPVAALVGEELSDQDLAMSMHLFYRYFGLTNEQVYLRLCDRVSKDTWTDWLQGIESNMGLRAFQQAWEFLQNKPAQRFSDLQRLVREQFGSDPRDWPQIATAEKKRPLLLEPRAGGDQEHVKSGQG